VYQRTTRHSLSRRTLLLRHQAAPPVRSTSPTIRPFLMLTMIVTSYGIFISTAALLPSILACHACIFAPRYPAVPPLLHFHSADKRMNPNLYACGKVCLSLLGTWPGQNAGESWNADQSSICQVLLSIMALILVPEPWYNEPGFESMRAFDVQESRTYTEAVYLMNLQLMIKQINKPPILFRDFVSTHSLLAEYAVPRFSR